MLLVLVVSSLVTASAAGLAVGSLTDRQIASVSSDGLRLHLAAESALADTLAVFEMQPDWRDVPAAAGAGTAIPADVAVRTAALNRSLAARLPAAGDTPQWRVTHVGVENGFRVSVWVRDDPADGDGNPSQDRNGRLTLRAEAVSASGHRRAVEATVGQRPGGVDIVSWRDVR